MTLLDKQIKAVQEAKEQCVGEALDKEKHEWSEEKCSLCKMFRDKDCIGCIFEKLGNRPTGCTSVSKYLTGSNNYSNPQDIACFLYSLELYLREQRRRG